MVIEKAMGMNKRMSGKYVDWKEREGQNSGEHLEEEAAFKWTRLRKWKSKKWTSFKKRNDKQYQILEKTVGFGCQMTLAREIFMEQ